MSDVWTTNKLKQGELELAILPGIGGRLWDILYRGHSLLFQNPDLAVRPFDLAALSGLPTRSPQFRFPLWGGEKTWIAPDSDWMDAAPYPVLDSAPYSVTEQTDCRIDMQSAVCPLSRLEVARTIRLTQGSGFTITHKVTNRGARARTTGIWSVMMLKHPATVRYESPDETVTSVFGDHAPFVSKEDTRVSVTCGEPGEFKIGSNVPSGRTEITAGPSEHRISMVCTTPALEKSDIHAHGHNVEVFNSGDYPYCEAEWHSPARRLGPGGSMSFIQQFRLSAPYPDAR